MRESASKAEKEKGRKEEAATCVVMTTANRALFSTPLPAQPKIQSNRLISPPFQAPSAFAPI